MTTAWWEPPAWGGLAVDVGLVWVSEGSPATHRDKIFTPFFTTKARGSGLGLPTAKRLIEAHNGQIVIESAPAGGTTVVIVLPIEVEGVQSQQLMY